MSIVEESRGSGSKLGQAVHRGPALSRAGLLERTFTYLFSGLVYPQIWEDPECDLEGLELAPGSRIAAIGSGGCNVMSYLTADPAHVLTVDLNRHHVHLIRLKAAGLQHMPTYQCFYRFFGEADHAGNVGLYDRHLRQHLPVETRIYWEQWDWLLRRRVGLFSRNIYRHGLLGRFILAGHVASRLLGVRLEPFLECRDQDEQVRWFETHLAPMFERPVVRRLTGMKASLFGLGIPPAQYDELAKAGGGDMAVVLKERLRKLACDFPLSENYFAHQAFGRRYPGGDAGPLPPYLQARHFEALKERAGRVTVVNRSMTDALANSAEGSVDAVVLLDAQDWMTDAQLNALWAEVTRATRPGARVLFRTADEPSLLPGRLDEALLARWEYREERSVELTAKDRSAIYGGVHLYVRRA